MLIATAAGLLLVGVGIVSARAVRPRLRYETWYYLHFYTYLAVALAFSHQFANGAEFIMNTAARVAWSAAVRRRRRRYRLVPVRHPGPAGASGTGARWRRSRRRHRRGVAS